MRTRLRFTRRGYYEIGTDAEEDTILEKQLADQHSLRQYRSDLSPLQWKRNLATLWILNSFKKWSQVSLDSSLPFLEVGCQDFSRLPALKSFFSPKTKSAHFHGLELDAFPVLSDLHSRWDRAHYYMSLVKKQSLLSNDFEDQYFALDFFTYTQKTSSLICFFPFVTPGPALSWGLPEYFGDADKWLESIERCVHEGGFVFIVHQGLEEEKIFDECRRRRPRSLILQERHELSCPFWPPKKPSCASLYVRAKDTP